MHLAITTPVRKTAPGVGIAATKNRAWGFFGDSVRRTWEIDPQVVETYLATTTTDPETASGVPSWPNRDPIRERGGVNLYAMVRNSAVNWIDYIGLNVYGVDGTNYDTERHVHQRTNVRDFVERARAGGEISRYYGGPGGRNEIFGPADWTGFWGEGSRGIKNEVYSNICDDWCEDKSIKINLVGWSRGAAIVQEVAHLLNNKGCCCDGKFYKPIPVNFLGLYDSVERLMFTDYEDSVSENVENFIHQMRTDTGDRVNRQQPTGHPNETGVNNDDGTPSAHRDIGTGGRHLESGGSEANLQAHRNVVNSARNAEVNINANGL